MVTRVNHLSIDGQSLSIQDVECAATGKLKISLSDQARERMSCTLGLVENILASEQVVYGVNTGFGKLAEVRIDPRKLGQLQTNLLRSHACGVGSPFPEPTARAMLLLRANVLATAHAGCRPELVDKIVELLNYRVHPVVPCQGSVGASGDLAPLAHLGLVLLGEGEAWYRNKRLSGALALKRAGIRPISLQAKEGLALINGTQVSTAVGTLTVAKASRLVEASDVLCALSVDALRGTDRAFEPSVHQARPHPGQIQSAQRIFNLFCKARPFESRTAAALRFRTPTRYDAPPRSTVRSETLLPKPSEFWKSRSTPPPTTQWFFQTAG